MARKPEEYEDEEEYEEEETEETDPNMEIINRTRHQLLDAMAGYDPTSAEYGVLMERLVDLSDYEKNVTAMERDKSETIRNKKETEQMENQKYAWILPTVFQTGAQCFTQALIEGVKTYTNRKNLQTVVKHEDSGEIITSKAFGFVKKN